jgi:hypothetical protein
MRRHEYTLKTFVHPLLALRLLAAGAMHDSLNNDKPPYARLVWRNPSCAHPGFHPRKIRGDKILGRRLAQPLGDEHKHLFIPHLVTDDRHFDNVISVVRQKTHFVPDDIGASGPD